MKKALEVRTLQMEMDLRNKYFPQNEGRIYTFLKFLVDTWFGDTDTPVLDFWWSLLWVSKPEWAALFTLGEGRHVTHFLRFTSGLTPAELLVANMAAKPFSFTTWKQTLVGLKTSTYCATAHSATPGKRSTDLATPTRIGANETFEVWTGLSVNKHHQKVR